MDPVSLFLLTVAGIFLVGILGEIVFEKTSVPDVVWLIAVGSLLGPITGLVERSMLEAVAPFFGALTLVVVLFEGGSRLKLAELTTSAPRATVLALLAFSTSVAVVAAVVVAGVSADLLPSSWTVMHGVTLGAILGGSSSVVIMPAMAKARLAPRLSNLVNLESALTDVLCVVVTVACIEIMLSGSADPAAAAATLGRSFGIGLGIGSLFGLVSLLFLRMLKQSEYAYPALLGALLILYVVVGELGGSAALAILAVAVLVGNASSIGKAFGLADDARLGQGVRHVHTQLAFIIKSFFFTFIGAMLGPPLPMMAIGAVMAVLLLVARVPMTWIATLGGHFSSGGRAMVTITLPRGMAAGVLAMLPNHAGIPGTGQFPVLAFSAVVVTILLFATAFPIVRAKLGPEDLSPAKVVPPRDGAPEPIKVPGMSEPVESAPDRRGVPPSDAPS
jgi:potassium/hydrogen antiporter